MRYCKRIRALLSSEDHTPGRLTIARMRCKMWSCEYCGKVNARRWRAHLLSRFNDHLKEEWVFVTLTAHANAHVTPAMSVKNLQQTWKKLYDRLRRHYSKKIEYIRVFEAHKSGRYHMHLLLNVGTEYDAHGLQPRTLKEELRHPECRWLSKAAAESGGGWRVHMRRVKDYETGTSNAGLVVGYITKYMSKNIGQSWFPKGQCLIYPSRGVGSPARRPPSAATWRPRSGIYRDDVFQYREIFDVTANHRVTTDDFLDEFIYPPDSEWEK